MLPSPSPASPGAGSPAGVAPEDHGETPVPMDGGHILTMVPHENFVIADELPDGTMQITHLLTRESKTFNRPGKWNLEFVDGYGFLVEDKEGLAMVEALEEWLDQRAWRDARGDYHIDERQDDGSFAGMWDLSECMRDHMQANTELLLPGSVVALRTYHFYWPRANDSKRMWSATDFYKACEMKSYKGEASKWFYNSYSSFYSMLSMFDLEFHVQKSSSALKNEVDASCPERPCQEATLSTLALLMVASRLAFGGYKEQGLRDGNARAHCQMVLTALLQSLRGTSFLLPLEFDFGWRHSSPRPRKRSSSHRLELVVDMAGTVDLEPWMLLATHLEQDGAMNECVLWWQEIQDVVEMHGLRVSFVDFYMFEKLSIADPWARLWFQVSVAAASAIDTIIMNLEEQFTSAFHSE